MLSVLIYKKLKIQGFRVPSYCNEWFDGIVQLKKWTEVGKLKYRETITNGFANIPQALIDMLQDKNIGKAVVKV